MSEPTNLAETFLHLVSALRAEGVSAKASAETAAKILTSWRGTDDRLLTPEEFGKYMNRSSRTVREWAQKRLVPAVIVDDEVVGFNLVALYEKQKDGK